MENENKKKQKVVALVGLITLLLAVLGATYAYFQISTNNESSNTNITGSTPANGLVTLKQGTSNLHLNISASDMSYENRTKEYYGTDDEQPYVGTEDLGTKTIASVELTGGEETTKYSCTAKLTVSKVTDEENPDTMIEVLQLGDMILQFKGNIISEKLDLSELNSSGTKEYNLKFKVTGYNPETIQAYIKLLNKSTPQNYLAGHKLNIDISTSELKCNVYIEHPTIAKLRENDENNTLSENIVGGMYRYQGVGTKEAEDDTHKLVDNNYICFGTTNKADCINEETGYNKYMYRIIGITEEGQLYLIKMKGVEEGEENKTFQWNSKSESPECDGDACEWPNSDIYKRLNGTESNGNPVFINNSRYEYMVEGNDWYNLIEEHNWMYGDIDNGISNTILEGETVYGMNNNGLILYDIETGVKPTQHYEQVAEEEIKVKHQWSVEKSVNAKIGLMYLHDYYLAYDNELTWNHMNSVNSWLFISFNNSSSSYEWFITRYGVARGEYYGYGVNTWNSVEAQDLNLSRVVLPTFYLSSDVKIKEGTDGTKDNPYILDIQA